MSDRDVSTEVAIGHKSNGQSSFELSSHADELLECSALAAIHTFIDDNLGNDEGAEVRKALSSDYWIDVSKAYLALAEQASGNSDLQAQAGARMRSLAGQWRQLTDSGAGPEAWAGWYDLVDRCDGWRARPPTHAFFNNGRHRLDGGSQTAEVAMID